MNWKVVFGAMIVVVLHGCGGGSSSSDATCSSFAYQEDAQANYSKALDRDSDGIACEDLPHRPAATTAPSAPSTPGLPAPSITQTFTFVDSLSRNPIVERLSDGTFKFSVTAFINPIGDSTGMPSTDVNSVVTLGSTGFRYIEGLSGLYLSFFQQGLTSSQGIAYTTTSTPPSLSSLAGEYALLGRRCVNDVGDNCDLVYGIAKIQVDGTFTFCPSSLYSLSCISKIEAKIASPANASGEFAFYPSNTLFGSIRVSSVATNGVSVQVETGGSLYVLFGQLSSYTSQVTSGSYTNFGIDNAGYFRRTLSLVGISQNTPVPYFSSDTSGRIYLRSVSGLLVAGVPRVGTSSAALNLSVVK